MLLWMSPNCVFVCTCTVSQLVTEEFTEMSQKLELETGLRQHAEVFAHQVRARGMRACLCAFCAHVCFLFFFSARRKTFCHTFTPIDTAGDRSCNRKGRRSVVADLRAAASNTRTLGRGGEDTHTHTHTHTSAVRVQLMRWDRRRVLHSLFSHRWHFGQICALCSVWGEAFSHTHTRNTKADTHSYICRKKTPIHLKSTYPNTHSDTHTHTEFFPATAAPIMKAFSFKAHLSVAFPAHLAPPSPIISGHHRRWRRIVVFKHNLSLPDTFMFCRAYSNCRLCARCPPFTGQAHNGLPRRGPYLWKGPPTVHTIQPLYSQFMVKDPPCTECLLCALLFVCFHVFWKHQPFTPLLCDAGWYNDAAPQTGNNLEVFFFFLRVCACVFVSLCSCVCLYVWNNCANCCVKIVLCLRETGD